MDKIKVAVRLRPFNKREIELGNAVAVNINENQVILNSQQAKEARKTPRLFTYDCCFDSSSPNKANYATQKQVYEGLGVDILENSLAGYNACIFAYGQTGSGKSYTMMGTENDKGLIPRLCESLFEHINANSNENVFFKVEVSYMEIYNEKVRDLLDPTGSKQNLKVREHQLLGTYVDGLSQLAVTSYKDIEVILNEGNKSRTVAATNMNAESSRSHAVFCVKVSQTITDKKSGISGEKVSRLSLVDLAGSEKVSKTGVEGDRLKEGCNINKSLHTLGLVISTLADNASIKAGQKPKHIPYRDSVLTWLLRDSIGGNSKTVMISTISPSFDNYEETLSTLRYADRAKRIVNNAVINEDPNAKVIRELREELEMLKKELEKAKEQKNTTESLKDRIDESQKLYNEISKPWNEKLAEFEKVQQEWDETLQAMGISVQSSGIKVEKDKYYLVNLNADPSMNELLVYYLKDFTQVGRSDAKTKQDIQLMGPGIAAEHCIFYTKNNHICVAPAKDANTWVNGKLILGETVLHHGDRIVLGINHFFRLNCPSESTASETMSTSLLSSKPLVKSDTDFNKAQEEILLQTGSQHQQQQHSPVSNQTDSDNPMIINTSIDDENRSTSSIFSNSTSSDENGIMLEMAIQKFEQDYSNTPTNKKNNHHHHRAANSSNHISKSSSSSSLNRSHSRANESSYLTASASHGANILNDEHFRKGLKLLREKLLRANSLVREANSICREMNKPMKFSVTMQIPAYNLTPFRKKDSLLSEPAVVVKIKDRLSNETTLNEAQSSNKVILEMEKFESFMIQLREAYAEKLKHSMLTENVPDNEESLENLIKENDAYYYKLIGVANLFLDFLFQEINIPFDYDIPIISQQGEIAGRLKVKLQRIDNNKLSSNELADSQAQASSKSGIYYTSPSSDEPSSSEFAQNSELIRNTKVRFRLSIICAYDLPVNLTNVVFCQYKLWPPQAPPTIVTSCEDNLDSIEEKNSINSIILFNHEAEFEADFANEDFMEYCLDGALSIEVLSHRNCDYLTRSLNDAKLRPQLLRHNKQKVYLDKLNKLNQMAKSQSLIDSWSEVSRSFEIGVKILELNAEGFWRPVEVKPSELVKTGGVYQLKQGQSRRVSVSVRQLRPGSVMHYNGMLFNLDAHKIERLSMGCVQGQDVGTVPLDSYQEIDLNRLKEKCRQILDNRKQYLHSQLSQQLSESNKSDDDKERYESLYKQLAELGDEQAAIDAPGENTHLPGSTIQWKPPDGVEQHVPIVFIELNDFSTSPSSSYNNNNPLSSENYTDDEPSQFDDDTDDYFYDNENYFSLQVNHGTKKHKRRSRGPTRNVLHTAGRECYLKNEHRDGHYIDLKLIEWNDSSRVEVRDSTDTADSDLSADVDESSLVLKAVGQWDSTEHKSIYLNKETPLDKQVYLIVKLVLRFKLVTNVAAAAAVTTSLPGTNQYVDVVLRKRISVCVHSYSAAAGFLANSSPNTRILSLNKIKNIFSGGTGDSTQSAGSSRSNTPNRTTATQSNVSLTGVTYRLIANIPKLLTEIENRESLAIKIASSMTEEALMLQLNAADLTNDDPASYVNNSSISGAKRNSIENTSSYFEQYAKTIEAVDSILKRDRVEQQLVVKKLININNKNGHKMITSDDQPFVDSGVSGFSTPSMKKTFSVPNLFKNGLGSTKNLTSNSAAMPTISDKKVENEQHASTTPKIAENKLNLNIQYVTNEAKKRLTNFGSYILDTQKLNNLNIIGFTGERSNEKIPKINVENADDSSRIKVKVEPVAPVPVGPSSDAKKIFEMYETVNKADSKLAKDKTDDEDKEIQAKIEDLIFQDLQVNSGVSEAKEEAPPALPDINIEPVEPPPEQQQQQPPASSLSISTQSLNKSQPDLTIPTDLNRTQSNQSIASTLTSGSQSRPSLPAMSGIKSDSKRAVNEETPEDPLPDWIKENVCVIVTTNTVMNKRGYVRYIGPTKFGTGTWIGVELEQSAGKNDGSVKGVRYFKCPENRGVFVRSDKLTLVNNNSNI